MRKHERSVFDRVGRARRPDFFGIGAEKCGTTWLWAMLRDHPDVGVPLPKELRYFAAHYVGTPANTGAIERLLRNHAKAPRSPVFMEKLATELRILLGDDAAYLRVFGAMEQPIVGEISPQYCMLPYEGVQHMHEIAPEAKIIFMMRDPVDRIVSAGKMKAGEKHDVLTEEIVWKFATVGFQMRMCRYAQMLEKFERFYGEEAIHHVFMEDIRADPMGVLEGVCAHIGAPFAPEMFARVTDEPNKGADFSVSEAFRRRLYARLAPEYDLLEERFPERVRAWRAKHEG